MSTAVQRLKPVGPQPVQERRVPGVLRYGWLRRPPLHDLAFAHDLQLAPSDMELRFRRDRGGGDANHSVGLDGRPLSGGKETVADSTVREGADAANSRCRCRD